MTAQAVLQEAEPYLDELEQRLELAVARYPGLVAAVGRNAVAAGGKRLRPLLVYLTAPERELALRAGVAVELAHVATLVHDDLIDGAELRRGRSSAWHEHGARAARAGGDYLFARAFGELAESGDLEGVDILARACLAIARGEAMQQRQAHDPETPVDAYLERIALKTGKIPGADLREGVPTLPLILAAREDEMVRCALAGGPTQGALVRVAATSALEQSRNVALDYARKARGFLRDEPDLEALTHIVIDRER